MTEETATVARLDYSKPPPGYAVFRDEGVCYWSGGQATWDAGSEAEALAAAWAHCKANNDPPWMQAMHDHEYEESTQRWFAEVGVSGRTATPDGCETQALARAAAWAWADRRHALVARLEDEGVQVDMWPHALVWTDSECLECERWPGMRAMPDDFPAVLRSLAEMPEVLRG